MTGTGPGDMTNGHPSVTISQHSSSVCYPVGLMPALTRRAGRRPRAIVLLAAVVGALVVSGIPTRAQADAISDKKAQAAAIAAKIDSLNTVVEQYAEAANAAQIELDGLHQQVADAQAKVAAAEAELQQHKTEIRGYAVDAYVRGTDDPTADDLGATDPTGEVQGYLSAAAGNRQQMIDQLNATEQDVQDQIAALNAAQGAAQAKADDLNSKRSNAANAVAQQQSLKNQVDSELNQLVAAAEAQRQAAANAAAAQRRAAAPTRIMTTSGLPQASSPGAGTAVSVAMAQQGKPYSWGAAGPDSFDCSGLVMYAWGAAGVSLPHYVPAQYSATRHVSLDQIQPGDIIYYNGFGHDALYIGGGNVVQALHTGTPVQVTDLYYAGNPIAASRP